MLKIKYNNNLLIKESHQIHTKTRKVTPCLRVNYIIIDTRLITRNFNFSRLNNIRINILIRNLSCIITLPISPPQTLLHRKDIKQCSLIVCPKIHVFILQILKLLELQLPYFSSTPSLIIRLNLYPGLKGRDFAYFQKGESYFDPA